MWHSSLHTLKRKFVSIRRNRGELLGVVRNNGYLFPGFQFDRSAGTIRFWVKPLLELAAESNQGERWLTVQPYFPDQRCTVRQHDPGSPPGIVTAPSSP